MGKDAFYFLHDSNASQDFKLRNLRRKYGWLGMGWWWYIVECLRDEDDYSLEYSEAVFESISEVLKCEPEQVKEFIDDCVKKFVNHGSGLLTKTEDGERFLSPRLNRDMAVKDERSLKASLSGRKGGLSRVGKQEQGKPGAGNDLASMIESYEEKTGCMLNNTDVDLLKDIAEHHSVEAFNDALNKAVGSNAKYPMWYIARILASDSKPKSTKKKETEDISEGMEIIQ